MRRRVLLLVVGMTTLVVLAFAVPLAILIGNNAYNNGVEALRREATRIALYLRYDNSDKTPAQITATLATLGTARDASVQLADGSVVGRRPPGALTDLPSLDGKGPTSSGGSTTAPTPSSATPSGYRDPDGRGPGYGGSPGGQLDATPYAGGRLVQQRIPVFDASGPSGSYYVVRVWADDGTLRSGRTGSLALLGGASAGLLLLGVVLGELLTRRIVRPLVNTSETAQRLAAGDVTARATTSGPREVADVGLALNRLADRIDQLIAEERETTADLSHRLRTPMTALRLDAEALRDPGEAERIGQHVVSLERMLTAVIKAARRPQREGRMPSCDAAAVVADRVEFWSALAEDQGRATDVHVADGPLTVRCGDEDLAAAVDALLENVIAHTPEGVGFAVHLTRTAGGAALSIGDDGPGLPAEAAVRGRSDRGSSGLGLDIARRCAESTGGAMTVGTSPGGGALVTLDLHSG